MEELLSNPGVVTGAIGGGFVGFLAAVGMGLRKRPVLAFVVGALIAAVAGVILWTQVASFPPSFANTMGVSSEEAPSTFYTGLAVISGVTGVLCMLMAFAARIGDRRRERRQRNG